MASLIERGPLDGQVPLTAGAAVLTLRDPGRVTSIMPFAGQQGGVAAALAAIGLGWPGPNRAVVGRDGALCLWTGRGQAFLAGATAPAALAGQAALTDQSDGWVVLRLEGAAARAVLARLVAIDLGDAAFPEAAVARTGLNHMMAILHRSAAAGYDIWLFRSMAASAVHEIGAAMRMVAARGQGQSQGA